MFTGEGFKEFATTQLAQHTGKRLDKQVWQDISPEPSIKEQDFDCLRDFLVDMCSATLPESPPSQEEWDQIRARAKEAAVEHAMHNRDEKKAVKKSGGSASTGRRILNVPPRYGKTMAASMLLGSQLQGKNASLIIIDDPLKGA